MVYDETQHLNMQHFFGVMQALGEKYISVYEVDLKREKCIAYRLNGTVANTIHTLEEQDYYPLMKACLDQFVFDGKEKMQILLDVPALIKLIQEKGEQSFVYASKEGDETRYNELNVVPLPDYESNHCVVMGFMDITESYVNEELANKQRIDSMLRTLADDYICLFDIEQAESGYKYRSVIKIGTENSQILSCKQKLPEDCSFIIDRYVLPEDRARIRKELNARKIIKYLKMHDMFVLEAGGLVKGEPRRLQARFLLNCDPSGVEHIYVGIRDMTDREIIRFAEENRLKTLLGIVDGLSYEYEALWLVKREDRSMRLYRAENAPAAANALSVGMEGRSYEQVREWYIKNYVIPEDQERVFEETRYEKIEENLDKGKFYVVNYCRVINDIENYNQMCYIRSKVGDEEYIVLAFRDVDEEVRRDKEREQKLISRMNMVSSLTRRYYCSYYVDVAKGSYDEIYCSLDFVREHIGTHGLIKEKMDIWGQLFVSQDQIQEICTFCDPLSLKERLAEVDYVSIQFEGNHVGWCEAEYIAAARDEAGNCTFATLTFRSIRYERELVFKSITDELTGFYNRRAYEDDLASYGHSDVEENLIFASIDVNGLKLVNDSLGHSAGDELLQGVSKCLKQCLGSYGRIYRIGGDEFAVILFADSVIFNDIKVDLEQTVSHWSGSMVKELSISVGYATSRENTGKSVKELAQIADYLMYKEKERYYREQRVDRRGQQMALGLLQSTCTVIFRINLEEDKYSILQSPKKGGLIMSSFSEWIQSIGNSEKMHPDDRAQFLERTDLRKIREALLGNPKIGKVIQYRKKEGDEYVQIQMEFVPDNDFSADIPIVFMFMKTIH